MRRHLDSTRLGPCLVLALLVAVASVILPMPALATERAMRVDIEIPAVATASRPGPAGPTESYVRAETTSFTMLGVSWDGNEEGTARLRVRTDAGWGSWTALEIEDQDGPDPGSPESGEDAKNRTVTRPLWVGKAEGYELEAATTNLRVHLVREGSSGLKLRGTGRATAAEQPHIGERASWGARPPSADPSIASNVKMAFVHHTAGSNSYSYDDVPRILRSDQAYHMDVRGWSDIGYNFIVDRFGRIWEGRAGGISRAVIGAHAGGFNTGSTGVAVLGTFTSVAPAPAAVTPSPGSWAGSCSSTASPPTARPP